MQKIRPIVREKWNITGEGYTNGFNCSSKVLLLKTKYKENMATYWDSIKLGVGTKLCYLLQLSECLDHFTVKRPPVKMENAKETLSILKHIFKTISCMS